MNEIHGIPAAPPDRDLPNHRRIREELLMKIDPDDRPASLRRRWGLPLGVATGVAAVSVATMAVFGGLGTAKPVVAAPALGSGMPTSGAASQSAGAGAGASASASASGGAGAGAGATKGSTSGGAGSGPSSVHVAPTPAAFAVTDVTTPPIGAGTVAKVLASCLGSDASKYHAVIAARTPIASQDADGAVIAVDSAGQYVQCETKGDQGKSSDVPPTFINDRMWGAGHIIEYFDSTGERVGQGQLLLLGAGHYTSDVARITISYGNKPKQYPAIMAGGAFFYAAAVSTSASGPAAFLGPNPYIHAFNAAGKEIYNQVKGL
ncbi:hypothetical protein [Streptacidiphilus carbonis]|uniref:hypothetical protein n=1 Tax=Streptacidiphilus carbonis TaxID=105422 RepID=UPI000A5980BF|nr:hypothetical protein [Streptacidiphilus carbonis]